MYAKNLFPNNAPVSTVFSAGMLSAYVIGGGKSEVVDFVLVINEAFQRCFMASLEGFFCVSLVS